MLTGIERDIWYANKVRVGLADTAWMIKEFKRRRVERERGCD